MPSHRGRSSAPPPHPSASPVVSKSEMRNSRNVEVLTYRLSGKLVWVTPPKDYDEALSFAQRVFRDELAHIHRQSISFSIKSNVQGSDGTEQRSVRISPMAWPAVVKTLHPFEIVDITIIPEVVVDDADVGPPNYAYASSKDNSVKEERIQAPLFMSSRSCPPSRTTSPIPRPPSPEHTHFRSASRDLGGIRTFIRRSIFHLRESGELSEVSS